MNILIATSTFGEFASKPVNLLKSLGYNIIFNEDNRKLTEHEIRDLLGNVDGVIAGTEPYTKSVIDHAKELKVISRLGVGLDNIDLECAKEKNIEVCKTQTTPAPAVAELTLGLILDLLRKISFQSNQMKMGIWKKNMGSLLAGKTLGIIGLGTIGKKLVELTQGFGLTYFATDINQDSEFSQQNNVEYCDLENLLERSDVVSIHLALSPDAHSLIDYSAIQKMKSEAIIINTSRGEVIDESSLVRALDEKLIAGAGLDVFQEEPYSGTLLNYDNVITTPHIGAYAKEIRIQMELEAAENLIKGLEND